MAMQKIKIVLRGPGDGSIEIDGKTIEGVRRVELFAGFDDVTLVKLEILALGEVEIDAVAEVDVEKFDPRETAEA